MFSICLVLDSPAVFSGGQITGVREIVKFYSNGVGRLPELCRKTTQVCFVLLIGEEFDMDSLIGSRCILSVINSAVQNVLPRKTI